MTFAKLIEVKTDISKIQSTGDARKALPPYAIDLCHARSFVRSFVAKISW